MSRTNRSLRQTRTRAHAPRSPAERITRRAALAAAASAVALLLLLFWPSSSTPAILRTIDQNILLVSIDTLRADALGSYGGRAATPNLDRLAREGLRFDFAHAHAVVTLPSHASILTGLLPFQHGVRDNAGYRLAAEVPTMATRLGAAGHEAGAFVGAFPLDSRFGLDAGFIVYDDRVGGSGQSSDFLIAERPAEAVVHAALQWLGDRTDPWFAWVHLFDPHAAYVPPAPFDRQYADAPYLGEVAYTDRTLGPLFDAVRRAPRPTLVIVTADHGEGLGDHGELTHGVLAYEPTLRVPLIVAQLGPGTQAMGRPGGLRLPARHIDLLPTVLDALALAPDPALPGLSLLPDADAVRAGMPRPSYFEAMSASLNRGWAPLSGVIADGQKYIQLPLPELYDLADDPDETANRADDAARVQAMARRLDALRASAPAPPDPVSPDVADRLRSLGYVVGRAAARPGYTADDDPKRLIGLDRAIHQGIDLYQRGRPEEAIDLYRTVIETRPSMLIAHRHLAFLHWMLGQVDAAIATLEHALTAGRPTLELQTQLGVYLAETGRAGDAVRQLEPLAAARGSQAPIHLLNALGIAYARAGNPERALATFQALVGQDPDNAMGFENIGAAHLERGDLDDARIAFQRAVTITPTSSRAHAGLGVVWLRQGNRDPAIASWTRAVELDPQNYDALYNLGAELINAGRPAAARPYLERFVRSAPPAFYADDIHRLSQWLQAR